MFPKSEVLCEDCQFVCTEYPTRLQPNKEKKSISFLSHNLTHKRVFAKHPEYTLRFLSENIRYISYFDRVSTDLYKSIHHIAFDGCCSINLTLLLHLLGGVCRRGIEKHFSPLPPAVI
jgi:hypothetical protein